MKCRIHHAGDGKWIVFARPKSWRIFPIFVGSSTEMIEFLDSLGVLLDSY